MVDCVALGVLRETRRVCARARGLVTRGYTNIVAYGCVLSAIIRPQDRATFLMRGF